MESQKRHLRPDILEENSQRGKRKWERGEIFHGLWVIQCLLTKIAACDGEGIIKFCNAVASVAGWISGSKTCCKLEFISKVHF